MDYQREYFANRRCAVTGGASGIGLALCEELLECGANSVVLIDYDREKLTAQAARLAAAYPNRVKGIPCDVTDEQQVKQTVEEATAFGGGRLDLLINCAGSAFAAKFTTEPDGLQEKDPYRYRVADNALWQSAFALNFYGAVYGCRAALRPMLAQRSGQVVNIISGIAFSPMAYQSLYAATKAALTALTLSLRYEFWDYGVRFMASTPGTTATAIFDGVPGGPPPEAQSPRQSAQRILAGVAGDERLILGDDSDLEGSKICFCPDAGGVGLDKTFLGFARARRKGNTSFVPDASVSPDELVPDAASWQALSEITTAPNDKKLALARAYFAKRPPAVVDPAAYAGKTAAVTGGASGVGLALCELLLECGAEKVVLADYDRDALTRESARLAAQYPGRVKAVPCNVSVEAEVAAMIGAAQEFFGGRFDLLIQCAGIGQRGMFAPTPDLDAVAANTGMQVARPESWACTFGVDFFGPLYGCRAVLPLMLAQGSGQIVNIGSGMAYTPMPFEGIYAAAKAALNLLTLTLRYEYWDYGIRLNTATPGVTATAIFKGIPVPDCAQSPREAATRILAGAAANDRLICGDDRDLEITLFGLNPDFNRYWDDKLKGIAAARRAGQVAYYGE